MNRNTHFWTQAAMIAAVYVVLTVVFAPLSFGEVQVRISEALTILPLFTPSAIPGLLVGCIIANSFVGSAFPPGWVAGQLFIGLFCGYQQVALQRAAAVQEREQEIALAVSSLLPDLEGVDTPEEQISIALRKAGIRPNEPYKLERFTVERHT